ncbi:naringenin-chalcone synthase [Aureococcus anophagefferens]|nr:naringenin-chalcone synthase [Aureococcus anophagefferens]
MCMGFAVGFVVDGRRSAEATPKKDEKIIPVIMGMATGNPPYRASQQQAPRSPSCPECNSIKPVLARIYGNSRIDYRFMAVPDFTPEQKLEGDENFDKDLMFKMPVEKRLDMFREKSVPLVTKVCKDAMADAGIDVEQIGKLVVVSSTGFLGPGLDAELIKTLGLWRGVDRSLIGFMGCAAAMNGFRVANDFAMSHPGKMALMVCVEISSVHTTFDDNVNDAILHAIFADGCAAAVISGEKPGSAAAKGKFGIVDTHGWLMEGTEDGITLSINENGISCILSKYLPQYIAKNMAGYVDSFLGMHGLQKTDMDFWAIHPGGRRIIEEAQNGLGLSEEQAKYSWTVLSQYGNILSPSVMFVLELILNDHKKALAKGERGLKQGIAFSFSPGVGAEGILINVM